jgi:hypothetical protein
MTVTIIKENTWKIHVPRLCTPQHVLKFRRGGGGGLKYSTCLLQERKVKKMKKNITLQG